MPFAEVDGARLWWEAAGEGPGVVLLHNGIADSRMWDRQQRTFAERFRVVRYDMRFFGRSDRPQGRPFSERDDLAAVLDAAGLDRVALVGNSLGGRVGLDFALERPERVWALVLVASGLGGAALAGVYTREQEAEYEEALARGDYDRAVAIDLDVWAPLGADETLRRLVLDNVHVGLLDESSAPVGLKPPAAERLGDVGAPTLVVTGDRDVQRLDEIGDELERGIPGARRARFRDADHLVSLRVPDEFDRLVLEFLEQALR